MKKYIMLTASLFTLAGFAVFMKGMLLFEEPGYVMTITYIGFLCTNHSDMLGMSSFCLQRYASRTAAALEVQKNLFFKVIIFVSAAHLVCMLGYITSDRAINAMIAVRFYFPTLLNLNITCMLTYLFAMVYGRIKAAGGYILLIIFSVISSTTYYDVMYINSAFGSAVSGIHRAINLTIAYIIVSVFFGWLWRKYQKADLKI